VTSEQMENGQIGIELMTAWAGGGRTTDFAGERLRALLDEADTRADKAVASGKALAGVMAVAGASVSWLAQLTGRTEEEVLQEIAKKFQPQD
jgi:hypothetical protein